MEYNFRQIEKKWQQWWKDNDVYKTPNDFSKPKYYVLDMFPYPSGAGLHVGHPLGYIASDIYARYKRLKGFNVLHPMGYDAFGLPAEQYAIEHGIHPAVSTENNINNFRKQLDNIGFCFDWDREVRTSDASYYKWTQWIFLQLFHGFYNRQTNKAEHINILIDAFNKEGNISHPIPDSQYHITSFTADEWKSFSEKEQQDILMQYRLAFCGYGEVNWCEALGTVLANDEVINGVSERGGYPVVKKKLRQWYLRITEYADRLLEGLDRIEFSESMKEMQTNWIGKSSGAEIEFRLTIPGKDLTPGPSPKERGEATLSANESSSSFLINDFLSKLEKDRPGYYTSTIEQWKVLHVFAKENRKNSTEAEDKLWQKLRDRQIADTKFRRQHPIAGFIPDFICLEKKLIIEIDGGYHNDPKQSEFDMLRTTWLNEHGYTVIRFTNEEVLADVYKVKSRIKDILNSIQTHGNTQEVPALPPSPLERGRPDFSRGGGEVSLKVYTTRPDTIFGVDFMVIAPEHELVETITTPEQKQAVEDYITYVKSRSERERMAEKKISGVFTGAYALNPFDEREIPVWISEYVLAGYGTGAIMAVPCGDERDFKFAKHFNIPVTNIIGKYFNGEEANATKEAVLENSGFINGMVMKEAMDVVINKLEEMGIGKRKVNYKMRDAAFSRQRYWGEPFPIVWKDDIAYPLDEKDLPLELPHMDEIKPGKDGDGPLSNLTEWIHSSPIGGGREGATMPGYAGSSWYFLRYMDPHNDETFCDRKLSDYWNQVDLYIGGTEHAVGHLLYSRMWTKALYDLGYIGFDEPYKKLVNQGMIQGSSRFVYRINWIGLGSVKYFDSNILPKIFISKGIINELKMSNMETLEYVKKVLLERLKIRYPQIEDFNYNQIQFTELHVDVNIVDGYELNVCDFIKWRNNEYADAEFILENGNLLTKEMISDEVDAGEYICGSEVEKMSKRYFNTVNPDDLCYKYGADTFRMYEMFLGPVELSKPWDTKGIEGVHRFIKKLWRLFYDEIKGKIWNDEKPNDAEYKILYKSLKKIQEDTERFSFNTAVSAFMILVNELTDAGCRKKDILAKMLIALAPYAPHVAEELWQSLHSSPSLNESKMSSVLDAAYPEIEEKYLIETAKEYPVAINGKTRTNINLSLDATQQDVEAVILANEQVIKWLDGKQPKKIIYVKNKMINVVVG